MVRIFLLKHRRIFASRDVDSLACGVEPHIVVQRRTRERGHNFSAIGVESKELRWLSRGDKSTMIRFIENQRVRGSRSGNGPSSDNFASRHVDDADLIGG